MQEVLIGRIEMNPYLGSAHVDVIGILNQCTSSQVIFIKTFAATFYDSNVARRQYALYADAVSGFKMIAYNEPLCLLQSDGAMR